MTRVLIFSGVLLGAGPAPSGAMLVLAISNLFAGMKVNKPLMTSDGAWLARTYEIIDHCKANAGAGLSLRQTAVYGYLCLKWCWFSDCDSKLEKNTGLDTKGAQRRADFLCGECPWSPKSLKNVLESVTGRTFDQCSVGTCAAGSPQAAYDASVDNVLCLLESFKTGNKLNYSDLEDVIVDELSGANAQEAEVLLSIVQECKHSQFGEDFVKCWAETGVLDCVYHEANQVAHALPDQCKLSV